MYIFILIKKNENSVYTKTVNKTVIVKKKKENYFCMLGIVMVFAFFFSLSVHLIWSCSPRNKALALFSRKTPPYSSRSRASGEGERD